MKKNNKNEALYELKKKSTGLAIFLSLIFTGAGSMYSGKVAKGIAILFAQIFLWLFVLGWVMWIVAPIVAYNDAKKFNEILKLELGL